MNDIDAATDIYGRYGGRFELKTVQSFGMSSHHAIWNLKDGDRLFGVEQNTEHKAFVRKLKTIATVRTMVSSIRNERNVFARKHRVKQ